MSHGKAGKRRGRERAPPFVYRGRAGAACQNTPQWKDDTGPGAQRQAGFGAGPQQTGICLVLGEATAEGKTGKGRGGAWRRSALTPFGESRAWIDTDDVTVTKATGRARRPEAAGGILDSGSGSDFGALPLLYLYLRSVISSRCLAWAEGPSSGFVWKPERKRRPSGTTQGWDQEIPSLGPQPTNG